MTRFARLSLHHRLLLAVLLPAALIAAVVTAVVLHRGTRALDDALRERTVAIVSFLAPAAEYGVISGNQTSLEPLLRAAMSQRDVTAAAVYDDRGVLLLSLGRLEIVPLGALRATTVAQVVDAGPDLIGGLAPVFATPLQIDDLEAPGGDAALAPRLGADAARPAGWVYVALDSRPAVREKILIIATTLGLVLAGLGITAVLALRLARSVARPVASLADAVDRMSSGNLEVHLEEQATSCELAALERGFNAMARSIADMHRTMQSRIDAATAQLAHQAHHDALTGLPNRRVFEQTLEEVVAASRRASDQGALCFIDLDRFKIVNDTCGHAAGDELLCQIARLLRQRVREQDVICRVGGDEFALILRGCNREDALQVAENLREAVAAFRFTWEERRFSVGASIGLIPIDGSQGSAADVLVAADVACYAAKKGGRNRVVEHTPGRHGLGTGALAADFGIDTPDLDRRLELHAQTIVRLGEADGVPWLEVLLRVRDEWGEARQPGELLARIAHTGEALDLDLWVARQTCAATASLQAAMEPQRPLRISLNLSRASVLDADAFLAGLQHHLAEQGLSPRQFVLELDADLVEQLPGECELLVRKARAMGCKLALQRLDGGSIRHLSALRPDYAKVSLAGLVAAYGLEAACNLAQAIAGMATAVGIRTVASEVEDPLHLEMLHAYGFELAQGHAVSPPMPIGSHPIPAGGTFTSPPA